MNNEFFIPDFIEINGHGANTRLDASYHIDISGAKNEVLGAMAAAVLTDQPITLENVPHISDVLDMGKIMIDLGIGVEYSPILRRMHLYAAEIKSNTLSDESFKFRASYYLWGALMARFAITGEFDSLNLKIPGGCAFGGTRAIDYHLNLMRNVFSARISNKESEIKIQLPKKQSAIDSAPIYSTKQVSHGATFHWMLSTATANRKKFLYNASMEPEVGHLLGILNGMGANLRGTDCTAMTSFETGHLLNGGTYSILPDRLETASYALLALALRQGIVLSNMDFDSCRPWMNSIKEIAGRNNVKKLFTTPSEYTDKIKFLFYNTYVPGRSFQMSPFPGKETDLQQIWTPVLATAGESSTIIDPIWPGRSGHLAQMAKFGLKSEHRQIKIKNSVAPKALEVLIHPSQFNPAHVTGMDLRGTFGLIVCAAMANGHSRIDNPSFALRGYPNLIHNLRKLGLDIKASDTGTTLPPLPALKYR
ncbi:MAG: hypothetical protein FWE52_00740 [Alphaproteobacteria bacterium]|nr:hypothetical protein [Alphaproteobacteria bacterium]